MLSTGNRVKGPLDHNWSNFYNDCSFCGWEGTTPATLRLHWERKHWDWMKLGIKPAVDLPPDKRCPVAGCDRVWHSRSTLPSFRQHVIDSTKGHSVVEWLEAGIDVWKYRQKGKNLTS